MVYASSSAVYGNAKEGIPKKEDDDLEPLSPYADSKLANERMAQDFFNASGVATVGLRYFNVFGKRQSANGAYVAVIALN